MKRYIRPTYEQYKATRIYKNLSNQEALIDLAVLQSCKYDSLVDNAPQLYKSSSSFLGKNLVNSILMKTYGTKFIAGVDAEGLRRSVVKINAQGMGVVVYYLAEALDGKVFDAKVYSN